MANNNTQGFEWDDIFEGEESRPASSFGYLAPGIYPFTVDDVARTVSSTGKNMLKVTLIFDGGDKGKSKVYSNIVLKDVLQSFLLSVGYLAKGERKGLDTAALLDLTGKACIKDSNRKTDDGTPYSEVHYFIPPDNAEMEW